MEIIIKKYDLLIIVISSLSAYLVPLLFFNSKILVRDWGLFNGFSYFVKSSVCQFHTIPVHNPYVMGGMDFFANPQSRFFSPFTIFDLILSPPFANLFSLITLAIIGSLGFYKLIRYLGIKQNIALIGSIIFIHSSWFSLHYSEGHIIFGSFQLIGLALYIILRLEIKKYKFYFAVLNAFYLLDGGIYAFIYTNLLLFVAILFNLNKTGNINLIKSFYLQWKTTILSLLIFISLASAKLMPFIWMHHGRKPIMEFVTVKFRYILYCVFDPLQYIVKEVKGLEIPFHFHEIGFYIGVLSFILILFFLLRNIDRLQLKYIMISLLFLWIGAGWFYPINPWLLLHKIPILNNAHVQTRLFLFTYLFIIIIFCYALDYFKLRLNKYLFSGIVIILIFESVFVSNYSYYRIFQYEDSVCKPELFDGFIKNTNINKTINSPSNDWGYDFIIYHNMNTASKYFSDPSFKQGNIKSVEDKDYKGMIYITSGKGKTEIISFIPGRIKIKYNLDTISQIQINSNFLLGWKSESNIKISDKNELINFTPENLSDTIIIRYLPNYLFVILPLYIFGLIVVFFVIYKKWYL